MGLDFARCSVTGALVLKIYLAHILVAARLLINTLNSQTITNDLGGTTIESFWASIAFILGAAITQPIYVSTSDVLGRKNPLRVSMILYAVGAIVFALARSMSVVIVGRIFRGLGAGGLDVLEEILLADITSLKERPKYLGMLAMSIATGSIAGSVLGAVFCQFVSWRWIRLA